MTYEEIISKIQYGLPTDENQFDLFIDDIAIVTERLDLTIPQREYLIDELLLNIEKQPESGFTSWSLIHFIEGLDYDNNTSYNIKLLTSLKRKPTFLALLLINRLLNAFPSISSERTLYLAALKEVASNNTLDDFVRHEANQFYEYQLNKKPED